MSGSNLTGANTALLLIDFQSDFLDDVGRMPVARNQVSPVLEAAGKAVVAARAKGQLIVAIGNEFRRADWLMNIIRRRAAIEGEPGTRWDPRLPIEDGVYLPKWSSSAFTNPALVGLLKQHDIQTLLLTGLFARACVSATAKDALKAGFEVQIIGNAIACASDKSRATALSRLLRAGAQIFEAVPA